MKRLHLIFFSLLTMLATVASAQFSVQKGVIEVFTGSWSQYSPDGFVILEDVIASSNNVIPVNIHTSDGMEIDHGTELATFFSTSYPQAIINRTTSPISRGTWLSSMTTYLAGVSSVTVSFDSVLYNNVTRQIDVYLKAMFTGTVSGDIRFNCIIIEDSVVGTGSGYNQVNAYNTTAGHTYYGAGNPIVGLPHRYVARDFLGGTWGTSGVIPASVNFGSVATYHYSYTVPANFDEQKISLVGLVSLYSASGVTNRPILNADYWPSIMMPSTKFTSPFDTVCRGGAITYTDISDNLTSWAWTFQGGIPSSSNDENPGPVTYSTAGTYITTLLGTNSLGTSTWRDTIVVKGVNTNIIQTPTELVAVQGDVLYQWLDCNNVNAPFMGETQQYFSIPANGSYAVEMNFDGCVDTTSCINITSFGIDESITHDNLIYPNPSNGAFFMEMSDDGVIEVRDLIGSLVFYCSVKAGVNKLQFDIDEGIYFVKIKIHAEEYLQRIIIQK